MLGIVERSTEKWLKVERDNATLKNSSKHHNYYSLCGRSKYHAVMFDVNSSCLIVTYLKELRLGIVEQSTKKWLEKELKNSTFSTAPTVLAYPLVKTTSATSPSAGKENRLFGYSDVVTPAKRKKADKEENKKRKRQKKNNILNKMDRLEQDINKMAENVKKNTTKLQAITKVMAQIAPQIVAAARAKQLQHSAYWAGYLYSLYGQVISSLSLYSRANVGEAKDVIAKCVRLQFSGSYGNANLLILAALIEVKSSQLHSLREKGSLEKQLFDSDTDTDPCFQFHSANDNFELAAAVEHDIDVLKYAVPFC